MLIHIIKPGKVLSKIASFYRVTASRIIDVNGLLNQNQLLTGQALVIPTEDTFYTVRSGDTLWKIAKTYGTTIQNIMQANQIANPNNIYIGLTLYIPAPRYQVQPREALWQIAQKLHISLQTVDDMSLLSASASNNVVPIMSITNFTATSRGENLAHIILASTTLQKTLFANIINIMKNKGYRGVNIDFENVLPADRDLYNSLLQRMVDRFHTEGYFVSTALAPKISVQQLGSLYEAHDYEAHGRIADFVVLMTYEWGCRFCPPQAISPLNQIKRVLDYAVTVIPREKIFFSFQLYDTVTQSPYYRYADEQGRMHAVWFEDARSAQAKFDTVKQYNLRGISYWASGFPFPQNWALLEDNFSIRKR